MALKPVSGGAPLHYVVVTGLDQEQGMVMVNDPAQRKLLKQDRSAFEGEWSCSRKMDAPGIAPNPVTLSSLSF